MNDIIRNNSGFKHFLQKYDDNLVYEVYHKRELGYSISELQKEYKGQITPSAIMHMTSGKMLRDRGLLPKK
jgi:thioredoxin-related protein